MAVICPDMALAALLRAPVGRAVDLLEVPLEIGLLAAVLREVPVAKRLLGGSFVLLRLRDQVAWRGRRRRRGGRPAGLDRGDRLGSLDAEDLVERRVQRRLEPGLAVRVREELP